MFWPTSLIQETSQDPARLGPSWGSILGPLLFLGSWAVAVSLLTVAAIKDSRHLWLCGQGGKTSAPPLGQGL